MTWLSEIVERRKHADIWTRTEIERMARVIREFESYVRIVRNTDSVIDIHEREKRAYYGLSPDAKEVVEEVK